MFARVAFIPIAFATACLAASCGDDSNCDALQRRAFDTLDEAIRASGGPCTQDSDCTIVGHSSACHDSCSRVVLASSLGALSATRDAINESECREFASSECKLVVPPCVAPGNAVCLDGVCSEAY